MLEAFQQWWAGIVGGSTIAAVLGWIGVDTVRAVRRHEREKAERAEVAAVVDSINEMRKDTLERLERMSADATSARRDMHKKMDEGFTRQTEFNLKIAQYMGQQNGRRDG